MSAARIGATTGKLPGLAWFDWQRCAGRQRSL